MKAFLAEDDVEQDALGILYDLGYEVRYGGDIDATRENEGKVLVRESPSVVVLEDRLREALYRLNPDVPEQGITEVVKKVRRLSGQDLVSYNHTFHQYLTTGVTVEYRNGEGRVMSRPLRLLGEERLSRCQSVYRY
jgi:type I restriction enzyme R subunit